MTTMASKGSLCRERMSEASWSTKIAPERGVNQQFFSFTTEVNVAGRTHYWYAMVADCWLEEYDAHPPKFQYSLKFLNSDLSHIPADERGLFQLHALLAILMIGFGGYIANLEYQHYSKAHRVHLVTVLFFIAYLLQLGSVVCEFWHLKVYADDGVGLRWQNTIFAFDQLSSIFQTLSELIVSFLLVSIACGWTLMRSASVESGGVEVRGPIRGSLIDSILGVLQQPTAIVTRGVGPAALFFPLLAVVVIYLELWGHRYDDDFNQFHDFEHLPGFLTIALRCCLWGVFLLGISRTLHSTPHINLVTFLKRFRIAGTVWFLTFPFVVVLTSLFFVPYVRHQIVTGTSLTVHSCGLALMSWEFLTNSEYFKVSTLSQVAAAAVGPLVSGREKSKISVD
eukprot:c10019_g1_i3.p1 GENE.c10019_g1_i3~~c10019_g1_i3.p1  ORF type:complete len:396 (+),score=87.73 c10019_g1_i3:1033-2220(+)